MLGQDLDPLTRQADDDAAVDDESGHVAAHSTALDPDEFIAAIGPLADSQCAMPRGLSALTLRS